MCVSALMPNIQFGSHASLQSRCSATCTAGSVDHTSNESRWCLVLRWQDHQASGLNRLPADGPPHKHEHQQLTKTHHRSSARSNGKLSQTVATDTSKQDSSTGTHRKAFGSACGSKNAEWHPHRVRPSRRESKTLRSSTSSHVMRGKKIQRWPGACSGVVVSPKRTGTTFPDKSTTLLPCPATVPPMRPPGALLKRTIVVGWTSP